MSWKHVAEVIANIISEQVKSPLEGDHYVVSLRGNGRSLPPDTEKPTMPNLADILERGKDTVLLKSVDDGVERVPPPLSAEAALAAYRTIEEAKERKYLRDLELALQVRTVACTQSVDPRVIDGLALKSLALPASDRWREAVSTALVGDWVAPLEQEGRLHVSALGALRADARAIHRQLVPVWRRRTRHGRVLSLDAVLGDGLSLYDLVAADVDLLSRVAGGIYEDERLNTVLRGLDPAERQVVFTYAAADGTTWTEAAAAAGATDPDTFGERVRRKAKRLAAEQRRRSDLAFRKR
ncbi:hypothetical protein ACFVFF_07735 [Streptomyces sp. NPDC057680]|uniref:hypothetical protein n=1 Tax=Streptomyces sp. NPDC057680 TaxID=3346208 RepID=UPI0036928A74